MKVTRNLVSENKPAKENQPSLLSIPTHSEPYYEPMDFFNSAEEAKEANEKSSLLEFPMEFYATPDAAKKAVAQYGFFVEQPLQESFEDMEIPPYEDEEPKGYFDYAEMPERRTTADIVRDSVLVIKSKPVSEESDDISKAVVSSLKKQIQQGTSETAVGTISIKNEFENRKPMVYKPTSYELSKMIISSIPMFICEEQLYMRQTIFYQRKSYADIQRAVKSWLEKNNMTEFKPTQINEIISLIFMEGSLVKNASDLNQYVIAFRNGLLDIYNGSFHPHNPQCLITYLVDCNYIPNEATCPYFNEFLRNITGGDTTLQTRIWQMLGYIISPDTRGKAIFLLQGISNSGKSVLADLIKSFFSSEAVMPLDVHKIGSRFSASNLVGKALCVSGDMTSDPLNSNSTSKLKQFSGNDFISSDVKHSAMVSFYGRAKFVLVTNHPLLTEERDDAFVERIVTIPFDYATPPERRDRDLLVKLKAERDAIATIAVQYYFDLVRKKYDFEGKYIMNASTGILQNASDDKDVEVNVYKYLRRFFESAENDGVFTDDAHRFFIEEYGYVDKKHFSNHFANIAYELFGASKERRRRNPSDNPISYIAGIRLEGDTQL